MTQTLENITGDLLTAFSQVDLNTISHAAEIMKERHTNEELRRRWQWTADFPMYMLEGKTGNQSSKGDAVLYLAPREHNLIFQNIDDAVTQIRSTGNYTPTSEGISQVIESDKTEKTLRIELSRLKLEKFDDEWSYFEISTASKTEDKKNNYDNLNGTQRSFAERVYGVGDDFKESMRILNAENKQTTRIYVLNPEYVKTHAKKGAVGRLSFLYDFINSSYFNGVGRYVDYNLGSLRGVRRIAEGDAQKNEGIHTEYTPAGIINYLSKEPVKTMDFAKALLGAANGFYQKQ